MKNFIGAYAQLSVHNRVGFLRKMSIHRNVTGRYNSINEFTTVFVKTLTKAIKKVKGIKGIVKDIEKNGADKKTIEKILEKYPNFMVPEAILKTAPIQKKAGDVFSKDILAHFYRSEEIIDELKFVKFVKDVDVDFEKEYPKEALVTFIFNLQGIHDFLAFITAGGESKVIPEKAHDVVEEYNDMLNALELLLEPMGIERKGVPVDRLLAVTSPEAITKLMMLEQSLYQHVDAIPPAVDKVLNNTWSPYSAIVHLLNVARDAKKDMSMLLKIDKVLASSNGFSAKIIDALR